jgi:putative multicomponent Na+:H+ antiporter subunit B
MTPELSLVLASALPFANDLSIAAVAILLPVTAGLVILQNNPYRALVARGILGAMAATTYALLGAADVALTEALMGTMLAVTLYAIAVQSSLVFRLGFVDAGSGQPEPSPQWTTLFTCLRNTYQPHHLRIELVPYPSAIALERALQERAIHATYQPALTEADRPAITTRVQRLHEIMQAPPLSDLAAIAYVPLANPAPVALPDPTVSQESAEP